MRATWFTSGRGIEPLVEGGRVEPGFERRTGQDRGRPGQQGTALVHGGVGIVGVGRALDAQHVTPSGHEQLRHVDEVLRLRARDPEDRLARRCGRRVRVRGQVGEHFGDAPRRDKLRAHLRQVAHVALGAPVDELPDELVELSGPQDPCWDRASQRGLFVRHLRRAVSAAEMVGTDDGHDDQSLHASPLTSFLQVAGRGDEELGRRRLLGEGPLLA